MTLSDYLSALRGKNITVLGIGVSNRPLIRLLLSAGCSVTARDKSSREALGEVADEFENAGCKLILGENYLEGIKADIIFRSPGIHPHITQICEAVKGGAELTSEMEAFLKFVPVP